MSVIESIQAIAEPTRFEILKLVSQHEMAASQIAGHFSISRTAVSQHISVLRNAALIRERREGTKRLYTINPEGFEPLRDALSSFWDPKLRRLKQVAEAADAE